jgi:predicted acyltransferase
MSAPAPGPPEPRIASMDQFRGFVVAGMVLVNFLGDFDRVRADAPVLCHNNTYLSFADTIMPAFHFAVGFSLRLTVLRRRARGVPGGARFGRRFLGLALIGIALELAENKSESWTVLSTRDFWEVLAPLLKSGFWNTLTIIAATSLWVLPVVGRGAAARVAFLVASSAVHLGICHAFYFHFMEGRPSPLSAVWGSDGPRGLDGGPLGFLAWAFPQLIGTFAYDLVARGGPYRASVGTLLGGVVLSVAGYALSCLAMLYPPTDPPTRSEGGAVVADSPVIPPAAGWCRTDSKARLAEPPFVQPAAEDQRQLNYWLMTKRVVTLPFQLASTGYALLVFSAFLLVCDAGGRSAGLFRTFGRNALATYLAHEVIGRAVSSYAPPDAPWPWVACTFLVYFLLTYAFVRDLEVKRIFLRM